jgi:hypothetical protein
MQTLSQRRGPGRRLGGALIRFCLRVQQQVRRLVVGGRRDSADSGAGAARSSTDNSYHYKPPLLRNNQFKQAERRAARRLRRAAQVAATAAGPACERFIGLVRTRRLRGRPSPFEFALELELGYFRPDILTARRPVCLFD